MMTQAKGWLAVGVPVVAVAVIATTAVTRAATFTRLDSSTASVCTFTIDDPIPIGPEIANATTTFTENVGDTLTASFPDDAHVEVISIKRTKYDGPLTASISLQTMQATAGLWAVTVRGERGECAGKVWVGQGARVKKADVGAKAAPATQSPPGTLGAKSAKAATPTAKSATRRDCAVFVEDSIRIGRARVEVLAKYTEPIGNMPAASMPLASKVEFISAKHQDGDEPRSIRLVLSTMTALTGQWKLTLWGDLDTCTGMVYVGGPAK